MLAKLEKDIPNMKLRLLGLRCSNLVSTQKVGINFFGIATQPKPATESTPVPASSVDTHHEICAEEAFEAAARQEIQDEMNDLEQLSQETPDVSVTRRSEASGVPEVVEEPPMWDCPICTRPQVADDRTFNEHVDFCLSRQTIREVVQDTSEETTLIPNNSRKRKTPSQTGIPETDPKQKRLFFQ
jgi:DNA polymerase kappa